MKQFSVRRVVVVVVVAIVVTVMNGCSGEKSAGGGPSPSSSSGPKSGTNGRPRILLKQVQPIGEILFKKLRTHGTIVSDYEEAVKFLSSYRPDDSRTSSPLDSLERGYQEAISAGREWLSPLPDNAPLISQLSYFNPPRQLLGYLIFCRLIRNAAHVADAKCQNTMVLDATSFFANKNPVKLRDYFALCLVMDLSTAMNESDVCPNFSLSYEMARIIIGNYIHIWGTDGRTVALANFMQSISIQTSEYENCQTEEQKNHYKRFHVKTFQILSQVIDPPPPGICIEEHVRAVIDKWSNQARDDLHLLNCRHYIHTN